MEYQVGISNPACKFNRRRILARWFEWKPAVLTILALAVWSDLRACAEDPEEVVGAVIQQPRYVLTEERFDQLLSRGGVFVDKNGVLMMRSIRSLADLKEHFESTLSQEIERFAVACHLTKSQKRKVQLASRGDVVHLLDRVKLLRHLCTSSEMSPAEYSERLTEVESLANMPVIIACSESSFYRKTLRSSLTPEQMLAYQEFQRRRRVESIEQILNNLNRPYSDDRLSQQSRSKFIQVLLDHADIPEWPHPFASTLVMLQASRLETQLKPLLSESQWTELKAGIAAAQRMEPALRKYGIRPSPWLAEDTE